jgi:hypothetical protein
VSINAKWVVRLGRDEWRRHTYERPQEPELRLLGSVPCDALVGALAVTREGQYLQINGDYFSPLDTSELRAAVDEALRSRDSSNDWRAEAPRSAAVPAPVIVVKRRRVIATA